MILPRKSGRGQAAIRAPCRPANDSLSRNAVGVNCTTPHHKTHVTTTGGYEAVVVYRWHPCFERTIEVREVIVREAEAVARCRQEGAPDGVVQELPTWMLTPKSCPRRASVPRGQAPVRSPQHPLPRSREEPRACLHAVRARQPVSCAAEVDGMRRSLPSDAQPSPQRLQIWQDQSHSTGGRRFQNPNDRISA